MSNATVVQDVFAFTVNHTSVLSDATGRILSPLILVAKLVLYVKRTDNNAEGPVQLRNVICPFLQESGQKGKDIWSKYSCDQIVVPFVLNHCVDGDLGASDLDSTCVSMICSLQRSTKRKLGAAKDSLARCEPVNVFERERKSDQHSESDLKLMILNFEEEFAVKNELKRMKHKKTCGRNGHRI